MTTTSPPAAVPSSTAVASATGSMAPPDRAATGSPLTGEPACYQESVVVGLAEGPGVYLVCWGHPSRVLDRPPGHLFLRPGISTAEDAIREWLKGPTDEEAAAGYEGPVLTQYEWFMESLTLGRVGGLLVMEVAEWEPIAETSTSAASDIFFTTLFGTVFSDPTVERFTFSVRGSSCPVSIGESDLCFPISREDLLSGFLSIP